MTPDEFQHWVNSAVDELRLKTIAHTVWGLDKVDHWDLDQGEGVLRFSGADGTIAEANAQIVGTWDGETQTWRWSWANESVHPPLARSSRELRKVGLDNNLQMLVAPEFPSTEEQAWEMTALAVKNSSAQGAYRGPMGETSVFLTFDHVRIAPGKTPGREQSTGQGTKPGAQADVAGGK
jgi:hypothetical protein